MATILGYANQIDMSVVSGGAWSSSYPLSNIQTVYQYQKARSVNTNAASTVIICDLTIAQKIGVVALIAHNFSEDAELRIEGSTSPSFSTSTFDSGYLPTYDGTTFGTNIDSDALRYWRISISDTANTDGFIEIGRVFIGHAWKPMRNISWGPSLGIESSSSMTASLGGPEYPEIRSNRRVWRGKWDFLTVSEGYLWSRIQRSQDITGEVYLIIDDSDFTYRDQTQFLGRLRELSPVEYPYLDIQSAAIEVSELL